jgi:hypothetical protein
MNNMHIVSESIRRANSRAVEDRTRWRQRYAVTSLAIRRTKSRIRLARSFGNLELERGELVVLDALRVQASLLMMFREDIGITLRDTAYRYAPREMVA